MYGGVREDARSGSVAINGVKQRKQHQQLAWHGVAGISVWHGISGGSNNGISVWQRRKTA